jgi:hypothetical protein
MPRSLALAAALLAPSIAGYALPRRSPVLVQHLSIQPPRAAQAVAVAVPNPKRGHDFFNLAVLPATIAVCAGALAAPQMLSVQRKFGYLLTAYNLADMAWISAQPSCVDAPTALLGHHCATLLCLAYCLTHPPHTRYIAWMGVVEVTTFFTVLKRWVKAPWVELAFKASWLLIRILWFSYLPIHCAPLPARSGRLASALTAASACVFAAVAFLAPEPWPAGLRGLVSRVVILAAVSGFAVLQLVWTWQGTRQGASVEQQESESEAAALVVE